MKINNILIINQPICNRGDESAHRALVRSLNKALPDTKVNVLAFQDSHFATGEYIVDNPLNRYINFTFSHNFRAEDVAKYLIKHNLTRIGTILHPTLKKLIPYYEQADVILCAPGGICMGGFQNWRHMYLLQVARDLHKSIIYYSRSIGPFPEVTSLNRKFKRLSMDMLNSFAFLSLRDIKSEVLADSMGIKYVPSIDTAFLERPDVDVPPEIKGHLKENYIVFIPNQLIWHFAYQHVQQSKIDNFYLSLLGRLRTVYHDHQIVMLPQLSSVYGGGDYDYFQKLQSLFTDNNIYILPYGYTSDIQQAIVFHAKLVVGARYHSIVFSINNEIPFVALSYEHKIQGLLEELGLDGHLVDISETFNDDVSQEKSFQNFCTVLDKYKDVKPNRTSAGYLAEDCFKKMLACLKNI